MPVKHQSKKNQSTRDPPGPPQDTHSFNDAYWMPTSMYKNNFIPKWLSTNDLNHLFDTLLLLKIANLGGFWFCCPMAYSYDSNANIKLQNNLYVCSSSSHQVWSIDVAWLLQHSQVLMMPIFPTIWQRECFSSAFSAGLRAVSVVGILYIHALDVYTAVGDVIVSTRAFEFLQHARNGWSVHYVRTMQYVRTTDRRGNER